MTEAKAFEAWWVTPGTDDMDRLKTTYSAAKSAWLAACAWQKQRDADIARHCGRGPDWPVCDIVCCGKDIVKAIERA